MKKLFISILVIAALVGCTYLLTSGAIEVGVSDDAKNGAAKFSKSLIDDAKDATNDTLDGLKDKIQ